MSVQPKLAIAIMAAGKGTRLKSKHPKVLHEIGGKPLLRHVIEAAGKLVPAGDVYAIIGYEADRVKAAMADTGCKFILQAPEQLGTGHAIMCGREQLQSYDHFLVLSGDTPLLRSEILRRLLDFHLKNGSAMTLLTAEPENPFGYGRVVRKAENGAEVQAIVEQKQLNKQQEQIKEINSGIYAFATKPLFANISKLSTDNPHKEYYLTDMAAVLGKAGEKVLAFKEDAMAETLGINTRAELVRLDAQLRAAKALQLMDAGVTIYKPETCVIDADVEIGADTVIDPFVHLLGKTKIGSDCRIRSGSVISNSVIGDNVNVRQGTIMDDAHVEAGAIIGPYSHLRPGSEIGPGAHVGNFVETKKVKLGKGSKANHLTYLGDAVIGEGVNIGAGTITCNYDGVNKHQTMIEDGVFVGSDSTLVAPVKLGKGAYVGAASCITDEVPADALAIGRGRQINKEGWAKAKREKIAAAKKS
ncbi:MAG TPA: bifunctional UDP-N-acetylglucosamine diphosphorylase/glucosamine-1-phosphate N-acetyltransferase GlmU [Terriglobales bacterium]|nr:bifunctional UDP-N-acetylglucosamine diphosphorylase/glucosamine-1-phosphate N-acetyltransferase GlmU [Terriglobales bacterium]